MAHRLSTNYRMNRIFRPDRACLIVPVDHGVVWGRVPALESPVDVMHRFMGEDITGFMVTTGIVRATEADLARHPALVRVLAIDAFWPTGKPETGTGTLVAQVEDAVRLGVDCVKLLLPWNVSDAEKVLYCERIGRVISEASRWEMPVMVEPVLLAAPRSEEVLEAELEVARVAYDLGADIIKITFPGAEGTRKLVAELGVPIVVAGGALSGDSDSTIKDADAAISAGAQGLVVGRKVWQRPEAEAKRVIGELARVSREKFKRAW
ncbi:class I fructose-bisphosphate aldolase [Consotaella salsifontis]|uniref:Fructose-bisphosphate aldolase, class I n=1 Tax=Consotaella salsifontis TaxID=1365950 RepID=A0A1T4SGD5_9HYPH|nr:deoxyribose-phosphate aldolase [Consotaella salsifontis]SKA23368.1 fructose-bisphosphate aldolase, class I [Consotaella salsifontis]SKA27292.1 fructose-bisphosphate aldolase, class I [Consotaella salsifontis]